MTRPPREIGAAETMAVLVLALVFDAISLIPLIGGPFAVAGLFLIGGILGFMGVKVFSIKILTTLGFGAFVELMLSFIPALTLVVFLSITFHNGEAKLEKAKEKLNAKR